MLSIDFESRSAADLKKVGLDVYAAHPTTSIICMAYAFNDEPVELWAPTRPLPLRVRAHVVEGKDVCAWNAQFELVMWNQVGTRLYSFPQLAPEQTSCTMAMAYAMGLPGALDSAAAALGIHEEKDQAGKRLMLQLSKPRSQEAYGKGVRYTWWEDAERLKRLYAYCCQDVRVERAAFKRMKQLTSYEQRVWQLDYKINRRGVAVDVPKVYAAISLVESEKKRLDAEMRTVTKNTVASCNAVSQIKEFLDPYGVNTEALDKAAIAENLATFTDPTVRKVLELRQEAGRASAAKFEALANGVCDDGRLRGCYQYSGANTRRWAGRRVQLHNLPRGSMSPDEIEELIRTLGHPGARDVIDLSFGSPMAALSGALRGFLIAPKGKQLVGVDYSAIEGRVLAWLAGQESALEVYRNKQDPYKAEAAGIFGVTVDKVAKEQRQVGKVAVLALGFGGGVSAFQNMARAYNVKMAPAFTNLSNLVSDWQKTRAEENWEKNGAKAEISREEFLASDYTKLLWRDKNQSIVNYWKLLEAKAIAATENPGEVCTMPSSLPRVSYKRMGSFLWCTLPGGGRIYYPYPEVKTVKTPWGEEKKTLSYKSEDGPSRQWRPFTTYGGSLAENTTQAVARDLLADAMLRLDDAGFNIVLHTHDEVVCETPIEVSALQNVISLMTQNPAWAQSLPVAAEGFVSKRYRK